jgi:hypothetical protein
MSPVEFPGCNAVYGKEQQDTYRALPAMIVNEEDPKGEVISCWELTDEEVEMVVKNRRIYLSQYTFRDALQPILPSTDLSDLIARE